MSEIDYGPLSQLIGVWQGNKGQDVAPEPDGSETTPYRETLTFSTVGDVTNAEEQHLTVLHYRQLVQRVPDNKSIHDETGYWMWDSQTNVVTKSFTIPRAVSIVAGGVYSSSSADSAAFLLNVMAAVDDPDWQIIQAPFMRDNAKTTAYKQQISVSGDQLKYSQTMSLDVYGRSFEHTDVNQLIRQ